MQFSEPCRGVIVTVILPHLLPPHSISCAVLQRTVSDIRATYGRSRRHCATSLERNEDVSAAGILLCLEVVQPLG